MATVMFDDPRDAARLRELRYRVTVPIANFFDEQARVHGERTELGMGAWLAPLNSVESERLHRVFGFDSPYLGASILHRLELHDVRAVDSIEQIRLLLSAFLLVVRQPVSTMAVVLDRFVEGQWTREGWADFESGAHSPLRFPRQRLATLRNLRNGLGLAPPKQILRALDHYRQSVTALWRGDFDSALVAGAISLETLLGNGIRTEISYRLCLRASTLVGYDGPKVFTTLKRLYDLRSGVVHGGKAATFEQATRLQQALMRMIPTVASLVEELGGYDHALRALDTLALDRTAPLPKTISQAGWWSYVPLAACWASPVPTRYASWLSERVWIDSPAHGHL